MVIEESWLLCSASFFFLPRLFYLGMNFWRSIWPNFLCRFCFRISADGKEEGHCVLKWYADISWESRCNIEINIWAHFYKILLVFEVPYQRDAWKKLKLPKVGKGCLKLSFFLWFTHWWNCLCETDWLGVGKDIKEILKFYKNELRL